MADDIFRKIKDNINATDVLTRYLGHPDKDKKWKSPFRTEKTASLCVKNEVISDFGGSFKGDCISFVSKYFNIRLIEAAELIANDFGISKDNIPKEKIRQLQLQREQKKQQDQQIRREFNFLFEALCDVFHEYKNPQLEEILHKMINSCYDIQETKEVIKIARKYINSTA